MPLPNGVAIACSSIVCLFRTPTLKWLSSPPPWQCLRSLAYGARLDRLLQCAADHRGQTAKTNTNVLLRSPSDEWDDRLSVRSESEACLDSALRRYGWVDQLASMSLVLTFHRPLHPALPSTSSDALLQGECWFVDRDSGKEAFSMKASFLCATDSDGLPQSNRRGGTIRWLPLMLRFSSSRWSFVVGCVLLGVV